MITKYKKIVFTGVIIALALITTSCDLGDQEDFTGDSTMAPTNPTLNVDLSFANEQTLIEEDVTYPFTVSLSESQTVDVAAILTQTAGTAKRGVNFDFPSQIKIPAGKTSASGVITIIEGHTPMETVDVTIEIAASAANVETVNTETVKFTILNLVEGDLTVGLAWEASSFTTDNGGNEIDPTDLADLRLLLTDVPYTEIIDDADGGSFETLTLDADLPDGEYYMVADFYAAMENIPTDLNLSVSFDQVGVINGLEYTFPSALNTEEACNSNVHYILAKVIKSGESYDISSVGEHSKRDLSEFVGTWSGQGSWYEHFGYTSEIVTTLDANGDLLVTGIAFQWMEGWWGEVIVKSEPVKISMDPCGGDSFIIENQYHISTTWGGAPQPDYSVSAKGTFTNVGGVITLDMNPVFDQDGFIFDGTDWDGVPFREFATMD